MGFGVRHYFYGQITMVLKKNFFQRGTLLVAQELLGKFLCVKNDGKVTKYLITEVEAYDGFEDKASHAHKGKTTRNLPMFGPAGVWYVYLVYGMHWMLNIVTGKEDYPAAVLIRSVRDAAGKTICGPARVTKKMGITKIFNNKIASKNSGLWVEDGDKPINKSEIIQLPRVGVAYAEEWAGKPYRFVLTKDSCMK
jgi:DNA-3-methyladenine glycosylase